jgi:hypothetical protein
LQDGIGRIRIGNCFAESGCKTGIVELNCGSTGFTILQSVRGGAARSRGSGTAIGACGATRIWDFDFA